MTSRAARLFDDYASAHRTPGNRLCHSVGIPSIVFSIVLALTAVPLGSRMTAAEPVIAAVSVAGFAVDPLPAAVFLLFSAACDVAGRFLVAEAGVRPALLLAAALFATGWAFQLVGHAVFEKNRPAFARNLRHLLIGPLWISRKAIGRAAR
ncbi:MAG TPA: Mpo1-like protein [Thermoanaerobaculia bacterium]|nr:Mpo1-like protein [Thermoanaerobaculia bacterium]